MAAKLPAMPPEAYPDAPAAAVLKMDAAGRERAKFATFSQTVRSAGGLALENAAITPVLGTSSRHERTSMVMDAVESRPE